MRRDGLQLQVVEQVGDAGVLQRHGRRHHNLARFCERHALEGEPVVESEGPLTESRKSKMLSRAFAQLLVSSLVTNPTAPASIDATRAARPIFVALRPLVNGPAFLPLHVQLATTADSDHGNAPPPDEYVAYDFLPADPTAAATLTKWI